MISAWAGDDAVLGWCSIKSVTMIVMKRYRVLNFDFDFRANLLRLELEKDNERAKADLIHHPYGQAREEEKIHNVLDLGPRAISILAYHNRFLNQARDAFVVGAYYPALTATCALGERILNHLIRDLRDDFRSTDEYKRVYSKDSFDDWELVINTLGAWEVLLPEVVGDFKLLAHKRNDAIHFRPETDSNDRQLALDTLKTLQQIIDRQFGSIFTAPWFIPDIPGGQSYIKKSLEQLPFIRKVYIPNSVLVGPRHRLDGPIGALTVIDEENYPDTEITDEEFRRLRISQS